MKLPEFAKKLWKKAGGKKLSQLGSIHTLHLTEENNVVYSRKKHVTTKLTFFLKKKKKKLFLVAKFAAASLLPDFPDFLIPDSLETETLKSRKRLNFQNLTQSKAS